MEDRRRPELAGVALVALTFAAALACGRLLVGRGWVVPSLVAATGPAVVGLVSRRRGWRPPATVALSLAALALFCAWRFAPETTFLGIPTPSTFGLLWDELAVGLRAMRQEVAPVAVSTDVLLLVVIGTWLAGLLADHLAFERDATAGALMPPLVLVVVAAAIGDRIDPGATAFVFASAAAAFLLLRHDSLLRRRRRWVRGERAPTTLGALRVGAAVGALAVVTGVVLGPHLPLAGGGPVVDDWFAGTADDDGGEGGYVTVSPLVSIRKSLLRQDDRELFTVQSDIRSYWRVAGLDRFDGATWTLRSDADEFRTPAPQPLVVGPYRQRFNIGDLSERFLPGAFRPVSVTGVDAVFDLSTDTVIVEGESRVAKLSYEVTSYVPPSPDSIPASVFAAAADAELPQSLERFLDLPGRLPRLVTREADLVVREAGATTPYEQAVALERYFQREFTYSLTSAPAGAGEDDMVAFLLSGVGYCEQFAGTFAAMARHLGIPARVAVGFTPGTPDPKKPGLWRVSTADAHAWPEVYIAGVGWMPFEPTPPSPGGTAGGSEYVARPALPLNDVGEVLPPDPASEPVIPDAPVDDPLVDGATDPLAAPGAGGDGGLDLDRFVVPATAVLVAGGVVAYVVGVPLAKARRRQRRRSAPDPRRAVAGAWDEAVERLEEAGVPRRPSATPREVAGSVRGRGMGRVVPALSELAEEWTVAAYGTRPPTPHDVDTAWRRFQEVEAALDGDLGTWQRWRRRLDPTPLLRR